jgi:hypothetical protein
MNSHISIKTPAHWLALTCAVLLLHSNTLCAAEFAGDPQTQARELLAGTIGGRSKTADKSTAAPIDALKTSIADPQE